MTEQELKIIQQITRFINSPETNRNILLPQSLLVVLFNIVPFGSMTPEFVNHKTLWECRKYFSNTISSNVKFRFMLEKYFVASDEHIKEECFDSVKTEIMRVTQAIHDSSSIIQASMANMELRRYGKLIRFKEVFLSNNEKLINLFISNLPTPSIECFANLPIPDFIKLRRQNAYKTLEELGASASVNWGDRTEQEILKRVQWIQRTFRAARRQKEEKVRISQRYTNFFSTQDLQLTSANQPYWPQKCDWNLANRIVMAAKQVKLSSTVHHLTVAPSIVSIFDDGLYGQKNLLWHSMPFKHAALGGCDVEDGDVNVICFGINKIDPKADKENSVDLVFDLSKLKASSNPCIFYKQLDFGYNFGEFSEVRLGERKLFLTHTCASTIKRVAGRNYSLDVVLCVGVADSEGFSDSPKKYYYSHLPKPYFISYNVPDMEQILTLNFFRFIDTLRQQTQRGHEVSESSYAENIIRSLYGSIAALNDEELIQFLTNVGLAITNTAEFNFYGSYQIDFDALQTIYFKTFDYKCNLPDFIKNLQNGNQELLTEAISKMPEAFKSYRFLNYLLSKVDNQPLISNRLLNLKKGYIASMGDEQRRSVAFQFHLNLSKNGSFVSSCHTIKNKLSSIKTAKIG